MGENSGNGEKKVDENSGNGEKKVDLIFFSAPMTIPAT